MRGSGAGALGVTIVGAAVAADLASTGLPVVAVTLIAIALVACGSALLAIMSGAVGEAQQVSSRHETDQTLATIDVRPRRTASHWAMSASPRRHAADAVALSAPLEAAARQTGIPVINFVVPVAHGVAALDEGQPEQALRLYRPRRVYGLIGHRAGRIDDHAATAGDRT